MELVDLGGFLGGTVIKNLPATAGDARNAGSIPGLGCFLGIVNGNPLQYSFLENSMQRSLVGYVLGITKSWTGLSAHTLLMLEPM